MSWACSYSLPCVSNMIYVEELEYEASDRIRLLEGLLDLLELRLLELEGRVSRLETVSRGGPR